MKRIPLMKLRDAIFSAGLVSPRRGFRTRHLWNAFRGLTPPAIGFRPSGAIVDGPRSDAHPSPAPRFALRTPHSFRPAFTLIELLIVVVIALSITAIAIPVLVPSQDERRVLESSRLVTTALAAARSRAIETKRPAGVVLERVTGLPEACYQLSFAEVPAPYGGGLLDARIHIGEPGDLNGDGIVDAGTEDWNEDGDYIDRGIVGSITDALGNPDNSWVGLIKPGDQLKLNYQGHLYTIFTDASNVDANGYIIALGTTAATCWSLYSETAPLYPVTSGWNDYNGDGSIAAPENVGGLPFQIIRQPARSSLAPIQLPASVAIDLAASDVNGDLLHDYTGDITILFAPGGSIDSVYFAGDINDLATTPAYETTPTSPIYLLVGKRQFIPSNAAPQAGEPLYNFQDLQARWIGINPGTGMVASAPPAAADLTATVDASTWSTRLYESRQFIREGKTIGDK